MIVAACKHGRVQKNGRTPKGAARFRCCLCGKSWTVETLKLNGMRIGMEQAAKVIELLCEGMSVLATSRVTGTAKRTILDLLLFVGGRCDEFMTREIKGVCVDDVQCDEIWQFVLCKRATAKREKMVGGCGDSYCYTAIERSTKLCIAWHMGRRNEDHTQTFVEKLANATTGRFHLSTDGWSSYPMAAWTHLGGRVDYGMLIKSFSDGTKEDRRKYSPGKIIGAKKHRVFGVPEGKRICTSHSERLNGSIRNFSKRMGRLTYCFSKRWGNHRAALALLFCHYNWCHKHRTLNGATPAMAHGIANHVWTVREMLEKVMAAPVS